MQADKIADQWVGETSNETILYHNNKTDRPTCKFQLGTYELKIFSTIKKLYYYCKYMYNTKHKMIKSTIFKQRLISKCNNIMHVKNLTQNRI